MGVIFFIWKMYRDATYKDRIFLGILKGHEDLSVMRDEYLSRKNQITVHRVVAIVALLNLALLAVQIRYSLLEGWILLAIMGSSLAICIYLVGDLTRLRYLHEWQSDNSNLTAAKKERDKAFENVKNFLSILLVVSIVSGYNAYQREQEKSELKQIATNVGLQFQGQGWCGEFEDIKVYDEGQTVVKTGGWPCIYVGDFERIGFEKIDGMNTTCATFSFHVERGRPGEELFSLGEHFEEFCISDDDYSGFSEYSLKEKVFDYVKPKLDSLKLDLCSDYIFRLTNEERQTYC
jgi:hypothetical protein